jgi:hypothetical protein
MVENAIFTLKTQIMATLTLVIVPAKKLSDGTHKIRIRVAHNSETRFITTDIVVRENEFKNGKIVHRPDKDFLNTKLQQLYNLYFKRYMELDYPDSLTCTQLVKMITNPLNGEKHRKFEDVVDEYLSQIDEEDIQTLSAGHKQVYAIHRERFSHGTYYPYQNEPVHIMAQKDKAVKHHNQHLHNPAKGYYQLCHKDEIRYLRYRPFHHSQDSINPKERNPNYSGRTQNNQRCKFRALQSQRNTGHFHAYLLSCRHEPSRHTSIRFPDG